MPQSSSVSFVRANIPGLPLESVFRQDDDSLRGKAERVDATWLLPSSSSLPHDRCFPWGFFSPASSREAVIQRTWSGMKHVRWCFLHFRRRCKKTEWRGSGSMRNIDASYSKEEQI